MKKLKNFIISSSIFTIIGTSKKKGVKKLEKSRNVYLLMVLASIFWAGGFIGGRFGVQEVSPIALTFLRLFFATIAILLIVFKINPKILKFKISDLGIMIILAVVGVVGYQVLLFTALRYTSSNNASILVSFSPLITAIFSNLLWKEKLGAKKIFAIMLGIIGVGLTISNWDMNIIENIKPPAMLGRIE